MNDNLIYTINDGVACVTINRPKQFNAITPDMFDELADWFDEIGQRPDVHLIHMRAAGRHFAAGGDIKPMLNGINVPVEERVEYEVGLLRPLYTLLPKMFHVPQPIFMSVRGYCLGATAGMVALSDFALVSKTAKFSFPQTRFGSATLDGISYPLPRAVGHKKAMELCVFNTLFDALEAKEMGMVTWVVEDEALEEKEAKIVEKLARCAPLVLRHNKKLLRNSMFSTYEDQLNAEIESWSECVLTDDFYEGLTAFEEKREPKFGVWRSR